MRTSTFFVASLACLASSVSAIAARLSAATLSETNPWKLSNINFYEAANGTNSTSSYVQFHLSDTNSGLAFEADCKRTVAEGGDLYDGKWYPCGNVTNVFWQFDNSKAIHIQHGWTDPSVGGAGQDFVTCFGQWTTSAHPSEIRVPKFTGTLEGTNYTQGCMEVYCTEMTA